MDLGALDNIKALLADANRDVRKEACWTVSNVATGTHQQVLTLLAMDFMPLINVLLMEDT